MILWQAIDLVKGVPRVNQTVVITSKSRCRLARVLTNPAVAWRISPMVLFGGIGFRELSRGDVRKNGILTTTKTALNTHMIA